MKFLYVCLSGVFLLVFSHSPTRASSSALTFLPMQGKTLSKASVTLPDYFNKRLTLVAFGFSKDSQNAMDTWLIPFKARYRDDARTFYMEIPMIGPGYSWFRGFIEKGMRKGIPTPAHAHVMSYYQSLAPYLNYYGFDKKSEPHILLVGPDSHILFQAQGAATASTLKDLFERCQQQLSRLPMP